MYYGKGLYDSDENYRRGYEEGLNMYMKDPKDYRAYIENIPKESQLYKGLHDGKLAAIEALKNVNHGYHVEKNYELGFKMGYSLKHEKGSYEKTAKELEQRGGAIYQGYIEGGRLYDIDKKKLLQEGTSQSQEIAKKPRKSL